MLKQEFPYKKSIGTFRYLLSTNGEGVEASVTKERSYGTSYQYRPNTFLTLAFARIQARHLFLKIKSSSFYEELRIPLLFVLNRCKSASQSMVGIVDQRLRKIWGGRTGKPPLINSGDNESLWMPWFELLGTPAERWNLAKKRPAMYNGLAQDHLYNEGFTYLVYLVGGFVAEDLAKVDKRWAPLFLRGTLKEFEASYFSQINYFDSDKLEAQVAFLDSLGVFLNTEDRDFLNESRPSNYNDLKAKSCDYLERNVRSQYF